MTLKMMTRMCLWHQGSGRVDTKQVRWLCVPIKLFLPYSAYLTYSALPTYCAYLIYSEFWHVVHFWHIVLIWNIVHIRHIVCIWDYVRIWRRTGLEGRAVVPLLWSQPLESFVLLHWAGALYMSMLGHSLIFCWDLMNAYADTRQIGELLPKQCIFCILFCILQRIFWHIRNILWHIQHILHIINKLWYAEYA